VFKTSDSKRSLTELVGVALVAYDIWRRLPRPLRRRLVAAARTHGPRLARRAYRSRSDT
jgi:hypothetical protein